jgi:hypothetical protein
VSGNDLGPALAAALDRRLLRCARLVADTGQDAGTVVHGVRKDLKRVRALLRLATDAGADATEFELACARIARALSRRRDADAVLEALDRLAARVSDPGDACLVAEARRHLHVQAGKGGDLDREVVRAELLRIRRLVRDLDLSSLKSGKIENALAVTVTSARSLTARLESRPRAKRFHALRKAVKRELHQRDWLTRRFPGSGKGRKRLKQLATLLGENQDISVLKAFLRDEGLHKGRLKQLVNAERDRIRAAALKIARGLYQE